VRVPVSDQRRVRGRSFGALDRAADYACYATSVIEYESAQTAKNGKEIVYWGTEHFGDPATSLSASLLVEPLANGSAAAAGRLKQPVHDRVGCRRKLFRGDAAVCDALLGTLHSDKPPSVLFTASHGMSIKSGKSNQITDNGGLLCQDWGGLGSIK